MAGIIQNKAIDWGADQVHIFLSFLKKSKKYGNLIFGLKNCQKIENKNV